MIRIGLRDARSHFGRFIMSIIAIALGVAFVVGSFCFREMLNTQVSTMMATNSDHDVYVRGVDKAKNSSASPMSGSGASENYNQIDNSLATTIAKVEGVSSASATTTITGTVLVDRDGNAVSTMGAPTMAIGMSSSEPWRSAHFTAGSYPKGENEIALHQFAADKAKLKVGDTTTIVYEDGPKKVTVSGIFTTQTSQAGAIIIGVDPSVARHYYAATAPDPNTSALIGVYGNASTPLSNQAQQQLADNINKALPAGSRAHAVTGDEVRKEATKSIQDAHGLHSAAYPHLRHHRAVRGLLHHREHLRHDRARIDARLCLAALRRRFAPAGVLHRDHPGGDLGNRGLRHRHRAGLGHHQAHRRRACSSSARR
jgi:putative ABC transport system permease protein